MGTHPIFESDFDCLTEMRLVKSSARAFSRPIRTVLDNGVQVVTQQTNQAVAAVGIVSKGGSRAQTASSQSTLNRSVTLSNIAPQAGVQVSSVLHRERTGVYAVTTPDQANATAASLVEAAQAGEVSDAARAHAQAALNSASGNLKVVTDDYLHMAGFQQTPLSASPFGDSNGIQGTSAADVLAYRAANYGGENAVVVGTGAVDHDALCEIASQLPSAYTHQIKNNCQFTGGYIQDRNDYIKNCHVKWAWNVPGLDHTAANVGFAVMAEMFGSWKPGDQHAQHAAAPMTRWIADCTPNRRIEHHGHNSDYNLTKVASYTGELTSYSDTALFGFYSEVIDADSAGTSLIHNNRLQQITNVLQGNIKAWSHGFSEHEIEAAKNSLIAKLSDKYSNPLNLADKLGADCTIAGNTASFDKDAALIKKIDKHQLQSLFFDWIYNKEIVTVYYGATEGAPENTQARHRNWDILKF